MKKNNIQNIIKKIIKEYYGNIQKNYSDDDILSNKEYEGIRELYYLISNLLINIKTNFYKSHDIIPGQKIDLSINDQVIDFINNKPELINYDNKFTLDTKNNKNLHYAKFYLNKNIILNLKSKLNIDDDFHIAILNYNDTKGLYGISYKNSKSTAHMLNRMQVFKKASIDNPDISAGLLINSRIIFKDNLSIRSLIKHEVQHVIDSDLADDKNDFGSDEISVIKKISDLTVISQSQKEKLKFEFNLIQYLCSESELRGYAKQLSDLYSKLYLKIPNIDREVLNFEYLINFINQTRTNKNSGIKNIDYLYVINSVPFYYYKDFSKNLPTTEDINRIEKETGYKIIDKNKKMQDIFLDRLLIDDNNLRKKYITMFDLALTKLEKYTKFFWEKYYLRSDKYIIELSEYFLHGEGKSYLSDKNFFVTNISDILDTVIKNKFKHILVDWENSSKFQRNNFITDLTKILDI